jgi:predicted DNA binding CopG/RHH family protein
MSTLNAEEQALLESVELGEWQSIVDLPQEILRYQQYAQSQINELEAVSIELPIDDLQTLRAIAQQANTSVDLLMASILHQYVANRASSQT